MKNRTEEEIVSGWDSLSPPLVSVCCYTYNQENYIREAIESFLMQETDFPFEIVIHDDASTDSTRDIIRLYQKDYPLLIKVIFQEENQFSKGKKIFPLGVSEARGKYVAMCDGDDFWLDKNKITLQLSALQSHPKCGICFHPALEFLASDPSIRGISNNYSNEIKLFSVNDLIRGGGGFCPTASLMLKREVCNNLPDWFERVLTGDYYLQVLAAKHGGALYLPNVMSSYRHMAVGSVSNLSRNANAESILMRADNEIKCLELLDQTFAEECSQSIIYRMAEICREFSNSCLSIKSEKGFRLLMERSWSIKPYNNKIQTISYALRWAPNFLAVLQNIRNGFYDKFRMRKWFTSSGI